MKIIAAVLLFITSNFIYSQEGLVKEFYDNGNLKSEIAFSNNIREGEAKFYNENGNIKEERNYINGRVDGLVKIYSDSGKLKEVINIEDGKREGPTSLFTEEGVYATDVLFSEGKRIVEEPQYEEPAATNLASNEEKKEEQPVKPKMKPKSNANSSLPPAIEEDNLEDDPAYYLTVEVMPEPVGGMETIYKKLVYPELAKMKSIEGTVKVKAFIDKYGEVTKAEVVEGIGYGCDEAARMAVFYTKFKPGLQMGKPVKVQTTLPIEFKLEKTGG